MKSEEIIGVTNTYQTFFKNFYHILKVLNLGFYNKIYTKNVKKWLKRSYRNSL